MTSHAGVFMQNESYKKTKFAVNLSKLRHEKGLSQRQAAAAFGVSQALLSHYETGAREPKLEFVVKVSDYYSVTTDYILGRTDERGDGASRLAVTLSGLVDSMEELKAAEADIIGKLRNLTSSTAQK